MAPEKPKTSERTPLPSPEALKNSVEEGLYIKAEKMAKDSSFLALLSVENLSKFTEQLSQEQYKGYRAWNERFMNILNLKNVSPADQRLRVMACQIYLDDKIGGFTAQPKKHNSVDGMCGPFTVQKIKEYCASLTEQPKPEGQVVDSGKLGTNPPTETSPPADQSSTVPANSEVVSTPQTLPGVTNHLPENMRFDPKNIFYCGDSYMDGIAKGKVLSNNKEVQIGAQLTNYIKPRALKFLENPNCKMLVINGGINDLYARGYNEKVIQDIINSYTEVINTAHAKGIKVAVYNLNGDVSPAINGHTLKKIAGVKVAANKINQWLATKSGADVVLDSSAIIHGRLNKKDQLHPTGPAYADLYTKLVDTVQTKVG